LFIKIKEGENLELETMVDDFVTFFIAGQETTANALAFCFLEMCKKPEIIEKARNEIDRVLGERTEITFQDITELKYCSAIFKETLRLFPPASLFDRKLTEKRHLGGFDIPPNTPIWVYIKIVLYHGVGIYEILYSMPKKYRFVFALICFST
jgi:cholesterol 24(S)-hydroxylase